MQVSEAVDHNAIDRLNLMADGVLAAFTPVDLSTLDDSWRPDKLARWVVTPDDQKFIYTGVIESHEMSELSFRIHGPGRAFEIGSQATKTLVELVNRMANLAPLRAVTVPRAIRERLDDWLAGRLFQKIGSDQSGVAYVLTHIDSEVRDHEVWVPISDVELGVEIDIGSGVLFPFDATKLGELRAILMPFWEKAGKNILELDTYLKRLDELRGTAMAKFVLRGDLKYVADCAIAAARRISAALRVLQPCSIGAVARSYLYPIGHSAIENSHLLILGGEEPIVEPVHLASPPPFPLRLSASELAQPWIAKQIQCVRVLLGAAQRTEFQQRLLLAMELFGDACGARSVIEKLVLTFGALESFLLKDSNEPIQANLSRRVAVFLETGLEARKQVIASVVAGYRLRSGFAHHGTAPAENDKPTIEKVLVLARRVLTRALQLQHRFASKDVPTLIDDELLSGTMGTFVSPDPPDVLDTRRYIRLTANIEDVRPIQSHPRSART